MKILKGFKTELDPNNAQKTLLMKSAGVARFVYNWGLQQKKLAMDVRGKIPTYMDLHKRLVSLKETEFPWMYESSSYIPNEALRNLDKAFDNFFRKCKLKKQGKFKGKVGFPQPKKRNKKIGSFRIHQNIHVSFNEIQLPRIGKVRLKEHSYIPTDGRFLSLTVSEKAGRWYVSVQFEVELPDPPIKPESIIGLDLGIKTLATCSDGEIFENPRVLKKNLKKVKKLSRQLSKKKKGSNNRKKAKKKLAKLHQKVANIRKDNHHKITTQLTKTKSMIVIEDLNVSGMLKNHKLAQAISDVGFYEFRRQLQYKGKLYGCQILVVDQFYPSSKTCSQCGNIKSNLTLKDRVYHCESCNLEIDRDLNAAINLEQYFTVSSTGSYACGDLSSGFLVKENETKVDETRMKPEIKEI